MKQNTRYEVVFNTMRYLPLCLIQEGMVNGRNLYGRNGELLLRSGTVIQKKYIQKLNGLGYDGLYIIDGLSDDIDVKEIINENLRISAVKTLTELFNFVEDDTANPTALKSKLNDITEIVNSFVENITNHKNAIVNMLDLISFDDYTYTHSINVAILSIILGISIDLNETRLQRLGLSAILHDIGKLFVPKEILNKPGKLTKKEFQLMSMHSYKGYKYLKDNFDFHPTIFLGALHHHEKFDGTGYPYRLSGKSIHLFGRIIAIADVYDALTSTRPYRKALPPSEAFEYIMSNAGSHFDGDIVKGFVKHIAPYPVGHMVKLSDNTTGIVMENYAHYGLRPKVKIIRHGNEPVTPYIVDLKNDPDKTNVTIVGAAE